MLDIKLIRENPDVARENLKKRGDAANLKMLDDLIVCDKTWRQGLTKLNDLRHERRQIISEIATAKKKGKDANKEMAKAKDVDVEITTLEKQVAAAEDQVHSLLMRLPNLLHETVPFGKDENENVEVKRWGKPPKFSFPAKDHVDLSMKLSILDIERASKITGARFFFLKNEDVLLDMALISFALEEMSNNCLLSFVKSFVL